MSEAVDMNVKNASVAICGLGGLGSNIAMMLARAGVGFLRLIDFDTVDRSNLNRQTYFIKHIGKPKADALYEQIREVNESIKLEKVDTKITAQNARELLGDCDIICEAFDDPEAKSMLAETVLTEFPEKKLVCGSGMSGIGGANKIVTRRRAKNLYVCGDGESDSENFFAPRVIICAGHQANMILRLIMGIDEP